MTPAPPAAKPKRRGGCLGGCLTMLVILVALTIFGVGAYKRWLRPYLAERVRQAQEKSPLTAWAAQQLGLANPFEASAATIERPGGRKEGVAGRPALPPDIALEPEPLAEAVNVSAEQLTVFQRVAGTPAAAGARHAKAMERHGWTARTQDKPPGVQVLSRKPGLACVLDALGGEPDTAELYLRCSGVAPEPDGGTAAEPGPPD